jgi:hypothetical protein
MLLVALSGPAGGSREPCSHQKQMIEQESTFRCEQLRMAAE